MDNDYDAQLLLYRKKHFAVEVTPAEHPEAEGEMKLSVTRNGKQWQSICLLPHEIKAVIDALRRAGGGE